MPLPLLNAVSYYSLLRGVLSPEKICEHVKKCGYCAVCISDYNNLYGLPEFLGACENTGIKGIIGARVDDNEESSLLYADGRTGYSSLCKIISERHERKDFILIDTLLNMHDGLHIVSSSEKLLQKLHNKTHSLYYHIKNLKRIPPWVRDLRIPALIAPVAAFEQLKDYRTHTLLSAIRNNTTLSRLHAGELFPEEALFQKENELQTSFAVFEEAIITTEAFAQKVETVSKDQTVIMPRFRGSCNSASLLRRKTYAGTAKRYGGITEKVRERIEYELDLIRKKGFSDYFLIVDDIVSKSPRTCGRGSAAASIVAYALGITNVDPIRYNLMFERFLNPGRNDPPDIDIDFAWDERDAVIDYVIETYGKEHTAMIATHLTCKARMAIREVARIHGLTEREISTVSKRIPWYISMEEDTDTLEYLLRQWPSLKDISFDPPWPDILKDAASIIGLPRGIGTHCGGVVMTPKPIREVVPVQTSAKGYPIIQWEKDGAEAMGLVKIDLLGNRSLAVIRDTIASVKHSGINFDEQVWDPQSDEPTVRLLREGRSIGVFYVESPAMRLLQRKSGAGDFEHMVIHSSIIRPAANRFIQYYIRRLHGEPYEPLHERIRETLAETFGIMVYQEDVSKVAVDLAGFSVTDADKLRKAVAKKGSARLRHFRRQFFNGAEKNNIPEETVARIWEMVESFSGYSFCKPHSASYVQVSFQSAWLKVHYPAHFMAAVLSNYGGFYTTQAYISEARRIGITVINPEVNTSTIAYRADNMTIHVGLCQIRDLSLKAQERLISERNENGLYQTVESCLRRTGIEEKDAGALAAAGAFDRIEPSLSRAQQFWIVRRYYRCGKGDVLPNLQQMTRSQYLAAQYRALGYLTGCHPLEIYNGIRSRPALRAKDIDALAGRSAALFGWCVTSKTVSTKFGDSMEFITFEDETGIFETVLFPDVYKRFAAIVSWQTGFLLRGKVTEEFGVAVMEVRDVQRL